MTKTTRFAVALAAACLVTMVAWLLHTVLEQNRYVRHASGMWSGTREASRTLALEMHRRDVEAAPDVLHLTRRRDAGTQLRTETPLRGVVIHSIQLDPIYSIGEEDYEGALRSYTRQYNTMTVRQACYLAREGESSWRVMYVFDAARWIYPSDAPEGRLFEAYEERGEWPGAFRTLLDTVLGDVPVTGQQAAHWRYLRSVCDDLLRFEQIARPNPIPDVEPYPPSHSMPSGNGRMRAHIDRDGDVLSIGPKNVTSISAFSEGLASFGVSNRYGYMNRSGEVVIPVTFKHAGWFEEGKAGVKLEDNSWCFVSADGVSLTTNRYTFVGSYSEGVAAVRSEGTWHLVDADGEHQSAMPTNISFAGSLLDGRIAIRRDEKVGYMDRQGSVVIQPRFDHASGFLEGLAAASISGRYGYIDRDGAWVIRPMYTYATSFSEGLAAVAVRTRPDVSYEGAAVWDGEYGFIDRTGEFVIPAKFDYASRFSEGLAPVRVNGLWGYIDRDGEMVIEPRFAQAWSFEEGTALVELPIRAHAMSD